MKIEDDRKSKRQSIVFSLAFELGFMIAVPIVIFSLLGGFLDKKMETSPIFILIGVFISIFVSGYSIYQKIKSITDNQ
ncbi:MAG: hypothetical protein US66_C0011G0006 [Candidatus Moranbacteria bacterium GW2011_GWD2_37_9]|nr:MAG: hypothetical protein US44_C0009G0020 [Candidatus Moranbacteria bacterium GW2011_GWD1_37_17]KKQ47490.1 MAG: hypothetical protein US66_C0011G0006 [Candidatus Moranbacteria bacterium GW2011_GWD2_37_9]HBO16712.1 hypothetical protein [Candidatus Moranbacteria bacterium]